MKHYKTFARVLLALVPLISANLALGQADVVALQTAISDLQTQVIILKNDVTTLNTKLQVAEADANNTASRLAIIEQNLNQYGSTFGPKLNQFDARLKSIEHSLQQYNIAGMYRRLGLQEIQNAEQDRDINIISALLLQLHPDLATAEAELQTDQPVELPAR